MGIISDEKNRFLEINEEVWELHLDYNVYINLNNSPRLLICIPKNKKVQWGIFNCNTGDWSVAESKEEAFQIANFILKQSLS